MTGVVALAAAAPAGAVALDPTHTPPPHDDRLVRKAETFAAVALPMPPFGATPTLTLSASRRWIRERRHRIPLPAGGNFGGIALDAVAAPLALDEIDAVLQVNARCQWLRAQRDRREAEVATRVLAAMGAWPAIRSLPRSVWPPLPPGQELADCDASHERQVAYSVRHGRRPST